MGIKHKAKSRDKKSLRKKVEKAVPWKRVAGQRQDTPITIWSSYETEIMKWRGTYGHRKISVFCGIERKKKHWKQRNGNHEPIILLGRLINTVATWHIQPMDLKTWTFKRPDYRFTPINEIKQTTIWTQQRKELDKTIEYYEDMLNQNVPLDMGRTYRPHHPHPLQGRRAAEKDKQKYLSVWTKQTCRMRQHIVLML